MKFAALCALVLSATLSILSFTGPSSAAPSGLDGLDKQARDILARATPAAPHFVVYSDEYTPGITGPPSTSQITVRQIHSYLGLILAVDNNWLTMLFCDRDSMSCKHILLV